MPRVLFIVNPISGDLDKGEITEQIGRFCTERKVEAVWLETTGKEDLQRIRQKLDQERPDLAVACGGDGTVNLVGRALLDRPVPLGILPLGSGNGLATDLGLPARWEDALPLLFRGEKRPLDVLEINATHYSFHLADLGFNAKLVQDFESEPDRGQMAYVRQFFRNLRYRPRVKYRLVFPEGALSTRAAMVILANARKYGTGAVVNPVGKPDDGRFEVCIFRPWPWWYMGWMAFLFFTGRLDRSSYVKIFSTTALRLTASVAQPMQVDGEPMGQVDRLQVRILPGKIAVIAPVVS